MIKKARNVVLFIIRAEGTNHVIATTKCSTPLADGALFCRHDPSAGFVIGA